MTGKGKGHGGGKGKPGNSYPANYRSAYAAKGKGGGHGYGRGGHRAFVTDEQDAWQSASFGSGYDEYDTTQWEDVYHF